MSIFPAKVMFADDDPSIRILIRESLEQTGFTVFEATNGNELLDAMDMDKPEVIILDVMMPGFDGYSVCKEIRSKPEWEYVPILLLTGRDDVQSIDMAYEAGATDFISKPINWTLFGHRVKHLLRSGRTQRELHDNRLALENAQKISKIGNWIFDYKKDQFSLSNEASRIMDISESNVSLNDLSMKVHIDDRDSFIEGFRKSINECQRIDIEARVVSSDGNIFHISINGEHDKKLNIGDGSNICGVFQDITERKKKDDHIVYLAFHDTLTGLANPRLLKNKLNEAIIYSKRYDNKGAVLFFDLDRFKRINDTLGHTGGDQLLKMVSERLVTILRGTDCVSRLGISDEDTSVARFGGDEFIVLLSQIHEADDVAKIANRIIEEMREPFILNGKEIVVSSSMGISIFPDEGDGVDILLSNANSALQLAKKAGGNRFFYYESKNNESAVDKLELEVDLRKALKNNEFMLYYQPQVNGESGEIVGVEGLLRWQSPSRGLVAPFHFIPLLEETGLIVDVGDWVLRSACLQQIKWIEDGKTPITISVNISVRQFNQEDFIDRVRTIIDETGADPSLLRLEITESLLLENADHIVNLLEDFRSMGFSISIDDFGTGYSSLSYLKRLPIDELKIDRSFVKDISTDLDDGTIAKTIIALAKNLRLQVIAEGVEIEEQLKFLLKQGCLNIQGYYFGKPVPPDELILPDKVA